MTKVLQMKCAKATAVGEMLWCFHLFGRVLLNLVMEPKLPSNPNPAGMKKGRDSCTPLLDAAHL